jgi:hypothetical protein
LDLLIVLLPSVACSGEQRVLALARTSPKSIEIRPASFHESLVPSRIQAQHSRIAGVL